ncbi:hypothetical protein V2A85_24275 [Yersinia sp. 1252 StPb PI]|uniref:hypothetical protein n=1 Tax=Yersinia sp. 1252 StPb PI TaxID=3117404 RepID=UPI003B2807F3
MKHKVLSIFISVMIFGIAASGSAYAQNVPFDSGGGGKTIYGPWKKVSNGLLSSTCFRTVYYKNGSTAQQRKWISFGLKC